MRRPAEPHARPRKAGAEKSRDITKYGECGAHGPRLWRVSAPIDTFPSLKAISRSYLSFFHHLFLASHNSLFMARSQSLLTPEPSHIVRQPVTICHVYVFSSSTSLHAIPTHCFGATLTPAYPLPRQLRDLIICPDERGVVNYVQDQNIMERDITDPSSVSLILCHFLFFAYPLPSFSRSPLRGIKRKKGGT